QGPSGPAGATGATGPSGTLSLPARLGEIAPLVTDCDDVTVSGWSRCGNSTTNAPTTDLGLLFTIAYNGSSARSQIYISYKNEVYVRARASSQWTAWASLSSYEGLTDRPVLGTVADIASFTPGAS